MAQKIPFFELFKSLRLSRGLSLAVGDAWFTAAELNRGERSMRLALTTTCELGERAMCTVTRAGQAGLLVFLERFRRRYALLIGLALSLTAVCVLSQFVLTIQVEGNQTVPTAVILTELRRQGLRPGVFGPGLDEKTIRTKALLQLPELSWMSVNLYGTRAQVLVREATPEPEVVDETATGSVVARASGIITRMDTLNGEALVDVGDTVVAGETLISGTVHLDAPKYSELPDLGTLQVRAEGRVYARTWRTLVGELPLESPVKVYTGEEKTCWSATVLGQRFVFSETVEFPSPSMIK